MRVIIGPYPGRRSKKERKVSIRIDAYDAWSLDSTLALIIHPALLKLKEIKHGSPAVADEDVPEHLRSGPLENSWDDPKVHEKWDWVLDEMIWAFGQEASGDWEHQFHHGEFDDEWVDLEDGTTLWRQKEGSTYWFDKDGWEAHYTRMKNGFRLFGVYYNGLWD